MDEIIVKRTKRKKYKRKQSIFPLIYLLFCLVLITLLAFALTYLKEMLEQYEKSRPQHLVEDYVVHIKKDIMGFMTDTVNLKKGEFEETESFEARIKEIVSVGDINYGQKSGEFTEDTPVYVIVAGDKELASIYLKSVDEDGFGNRVWQIDQIKPGSFSNEKYKIVAPSNLDIVVNGKTVSNDRLVETDKKLSFPVKYSADFDAPEMKEVVLEGFYKKPEVVVSDKQGNPTEVVFDEQRNTFTAVFKDNVEISEEMFDYIFDIYAKYGRFTMKSSGFGEVSPYVDKKSHLYKNMQNMERWNDPPKSIDYENKTMWDCYSYSKDKVSCKIFADQYVNTNNRRVHSPVMYEVFMKKIDGKWLLSDMRVLTNADLPEKLRQSGTE